MIRITITYRCNHPGKPLPEIVEKYWNSTPENIDKVCYCLPDGENGKFKPTQMIKHFKFEEVKPE